MKSMGLNCLSQSGCLYFLTGGGLSSPEQVRSLYFTNGGSQTALVNKIQKFAPPLPPPPWEKDHHILAPFLAKFSKFTLF